MVLLVIKAILIVQSSFVNSLSGELPISPLVSLGEGVHDIIPSNRFEFADLL